MICSTCHNPIQWNREAGGWLHSLPLAKMRVTHWEAQDIAAADPDRFKNKGGRRSILHPAQPDRSY